MDSNSSFGNKVYEIIWLAVLCYILIVRRTEGSWHIYIKICANVFINNRLLIIVNSYYPLVKEID